MPATNVIIYYLLFNVIHFYMTLHIRQFKGNSTGFYTLLNSWAFMAMLAKYGFLIYWGLAHNWVQAAVLFGITLAVAPFDGIFAAWLERKIPSLPFLLSLSGFVTLPVLGILLFLGR